MDVIHIHRRQRKPMGKSRMDTPETLAILVHMTQDEAGQTTQITQHRKLKSRAIWTPPKTGDETRCSRYSCCLLQDIRRVTHIVNTYWLPLIELLLILVIPIVGQMQGRSLEVRAQLLSVKSAMCCVYLNNRE